MEEIKMRKIFIVFLILLCMIIPISADFTKLIEYSDSSTDTWSFGGGTTTTKTYQGLKLHFENIENYADISDIYIQPDENINYYASGYTGTAVFPCRLRDTSNATRIYSYGTLTILNNGGGSESVSVDLSDWNNYGSYGAVEMFIEVKPAATWLAIYLNPDSSMGGHTKTDYEYDENVVIQQGYISAGDNWLVDGRVYLDRLSEYKAELDIKSTYEDTLLITAVNLTRVIDEIPYASWFSVKDYNNYWYQYPDLGIVDIQSPLASTYPLYVNVSFGSPIVYTYVMSYYANGTAIEDPPWIPTPTPTVTATPTPVPELCGYWSLAVNTSNIKMNEYVQGTLTETDPSDRYDMIDWYVVSNGQEYLMKHFVYDPGLFGLGAGWFEVTQAGNTYASSAAEAMEQEIQFTTAGTKFIRAKIYDDVSILPIAYHDYDLVCTLDQVVYVALTTQASNTLGINVKECDTNAMLPYVNIGVYDYQTGQWQNKTSEMISTTYFNVVPGHNVRVVANKTGWLNSDTDYTIPTTPYLYEVCLKRPLVDIEDKSYVFFNVRDSVTLTGLFQANIQLSDGQIQNTLPSGYAGFSVNDGETYIYTVTKPGYQSFSDSFSISEDTTIPVRLVQISPTPTLTYPVTTLPTVTITGTGTVTPTGTGTGVWSNTTATLSPADKTYKTTKGLDIWYANLETLSGLLFVAAVFGAIGLISDSMSRRRRR
jgi:hypothetical protein